jgi:hypothetical protein
MHWMLTAGLALCLGCATTTGVHRPPTFAEMTEINTLAVAAGKLTVEYDPPADAGQPVVPLKTELPRGYLASAELNRLTIVAPDRPPLVLPLDRVRSVSARTHTPGAIEGFMVGVATTIVGGIVISQRVRGQKNEECDTICGPAGSTLIGTALLGLFAIPVSTLVGVAVGHRQTFDFRSPPVPPPPALPSNAWGL